MTTEFRYVYAWGNNPTRRALKGKRCRVIATGSRLHAVLLEFEDGERMISSVRSIRKVRPSKG